MTTAYHIVDCVAFSNRGGQRRTQDQSRQRNGCAWTWSRTIIDVDDELLCIGRVSTDRTKRETGKWWSDITAQSAAGAAETATSDSSSGGRRRSRCNHGRPRRASSVHSRRLYRQVQQADQHNGVVNAERWSKFPSRWATVQDFDEAHSPAAQGTAFPSEAVLRLYQERHGVAFSVRGDHEGVQRQNGPC